MLGWKPMQDWTHFFFFFFAQLLCLQAFKKLCTTARYGMSNKEHSLISLIILWQTQEASKVFEHLVSLGLKPNAKSYSLLIEAHLINRDVKSALAVIDDMVSTLFFFL